MEKPEATPTIKNIRVVFPDVSQMPVLHVNAMNLRFSTDEFFFTIGTAVPPEFEHAEDAKDFEQVTAQPLFRFAASRETMKQFIDLMIRQYNEQEKIGLARPDKGEAAPSE
jgi:hypothetical protein